MRPGGRNGEGRPEPYATNTPTTMTPKDQLREELMQALHSAQFLVRHLRAAHSKAIEDSDQFGEIAIMDALDDAAALCAKMERLSNAAGNA